MTSIEPSVIIKKMSHIVLDIDQTLIDHRLDEPHESYDHVHCDQSTLDTIYIYKRPYMDKFIKFCFHQFETVSLWTAGCQGWLNMFLKHVVDQQYSDKFLFTYSHDRCKTVNIYTGCYSSKTYHTKQLRKIWNTGKAKNAGITKYNLLMVDDTPQNYGYNYGNGIPIKPFDVDDMEKDCELWKLCSYLKDLSKVKNVRKIDKRCWFYDDNDDSHSDS